MRSASYHYLARKVAAARPTRAGRQILRGLRVAAAQSALSEAPPSAPAVPPAPALASAAAPVADAPSRAPRQASSLGTLAGGRT
jgi:hypothetical protein